MEQAHRIKDTFTLYGSHQAQRLPLASICRNGLFLVLERLHLYSVPRIISAECIQDGNTLLSGNSHL